MATLDAIRKKEQERIAANTATFVANSKEMPAGNAVYDSYGNLRAEKAAEFKLADSWIKKYNQVISGASEFQKSWNGRYSKDITGGHFSDIQSLIDDYDRVKKAVGVQAPHYLKQLRSIQNTQSQMDSDRAKFGSDSQYNAAVWGSKYSGKPLQEIRDSIASGQIEQDEKDWLTQYITSPEYTSGLSAADISSMKNEWDDAYNAQAAKIRELTNKKVGYSRSGLMQAEAKQASEDLEAAKATLEDIKTKKQQLEWAHNLAQRKEYVSSTYGSLDKNSDFVSKSRAGAAKANPTAQQMLEYAQRYESGEAYDGKKLTVSNPLEYYLANYQDAGAASRDSLILKGDSANWKYLADDEHKQERARYNYLLETKGVDAAEKYLDDIGVFLDQYASRKQEKKTAADYSKSGFGGKAAMNIASIPANVFGGVLNAAGQAASMANSKLTGSAFNPYIGGEIQQYGKDVRQNTSQDIIDSIGKKHPTWGKVVANTYQALMSGADSALGATLLGNGYTVMMGAGAASQRAAELYEAGASDVQIGLGAVASGFIEYATEKWSIERFTEKYIKGHINDFWDGAFNVFIQSLNEGSEEVASELANMVTNAMVLGANSDNQREVRKLMLAGLSRAEAEKTAFRNRVNDVLWAAYGGAVSGGAMGGFGTMINEAINHGKYMESGRNILKADTREALVEQAGNTRLSRKVSRDVKNGNTDAAATKRAGRLYANTTSQQIENIRTAERGAVREAVAEELKTRNISDPSGVIAAAIEKAAYGEDMSRAERRLYENLGGGEILQNVAGNEAVQRSVEKATAQSRKQLRETAALTTPTSSLAKMVGEADLNVNTDGKTLVTVDGNTRNAEVRRLQNVDGRLAIQLADGSAVSAEQVSFPDAGQAALYTVISRMSIPEASANALIAAAPSGEAEMERYAYGLQEMYRYGAIGVPMSAVRNAYFAGGITAAQREMAYNLGRETYQKNNAAAQGKTQTAVARGEGKVIFDGNEKQLTAMQRTSLNALRLIAKATGVNIQVFQSQVDESGRHIGENGSYDPETGTIRIDLSAGQDGKGTMLFTMAHELTHFMKQWNASGYQTFSEFLLKNYADSEVAVDTLVQRQIQKAEANGRTIDYDTAMEEVVADSCEQMLTSGDAIERLMELRAADRTVFDKVKKLYPLHGRKGQEGLPGAGTGQQGSTVCSHHVGCLR